MSLINFYENLHQSRQIVVNVSVNSKILSVTTVFKRPELMSSLHLADVDMLSCM